jgi:hypothetical protein
MEVLECTSCPVSGACDELKLSLSPGHQAEEHTKKDSACIHKKDLVNSIE